METKEAGVRVIPKEVAFQICQQIRKEKGVRLFSQCWGCVKFSKNDPDKMCFSSPNNRGCKTVNERYDTSIGAKTK